jgi:hypothetical protein
LESKKIDGEIASKCLRLLIECQVV